MATKKADKSASTTAKKPSFEGRGKLTEYHKTPAGEQLSGHRFVFTVPDPSLKIGDDSKLAKRPRFGKLTIDYFPDPDHAASIEMSGKFKRAAKYPEKENDAGVWTIAFQPSDLNGDDLHKLISLEHKAVDVDIVFAGSYDQKEIFPDAGDEDDDLDA